MFLILFLICFILGAALYKKPERYFLPSFYMLLLVPTSTSMSKINLFSGIYFFDGLFLGILLSHIILQKVKYSDIKVTSSLLIFILITVLYTIIGVFSEFHIKYLLKDLRPAIYIIEFWIAYELVFKYMTLRGMEKKILILITICSLLSLVKILFLKFGFFSTNDKFYIENSYRYLDAMTYVCAIYIVYSFNLKIKLPVNAFLRYLSTTASFICVLLSNSRFLLLAICVVLLVSNLQKIESFFYKSLAATFLFVTFVFMSQLFDAVRVIENLSVMGVYEQLLIRYSPFFALFDEAEWYNYIFGFGFGVPFEIPWFSYRENIDDLNANLDSAYLTLYAKYGVVLLLVFGKLFTFYSIEKNVKGSKYIFGLLLIMSFVSATLYQIYAIGFYLGWLLIRQLELDEYRLHMKHGEQLR